MKIGAIQRWAAVVFSTGIVLVADCCGGTLTAQAASSGPRPLFTGVTDAYFNFEDPVTPSHVRAAGAKFVRIQASWPSVAPQIEPGGWHPEDPADPNYDWDQIDLAVTGAVAAGLTPVLSIEGAPPWVQRCQAPRAVAGRLCDPDPAALAAFATAAARRYSGSFQGLPRVRYWQGLNEPNLSLYLNPQYGEDGRPISPYLYRRLINAFYFAVKSVDRSNLVLAAGLGPIAVRHWTIGPMRFARLLLCMKGRRNPHPTAGTCGGGVHFDIFDIHPYTTGGPTHKGGADDVELGDLNKLQKLLKAADRAGRIHGQFRRTPLWITEFSWDSKPPDPGGLRMAIEARWAAQALYRAWKAGVSHFFWYSLRDEAPNPMLPFSETYQSGLYFRGATVADDRPKKVLYAFRFPFVAFHPKGRLTFWGRTPDSGGGRVVIQIRRRARWRVVSRTQADAYGIFRGSVRTAYGHDKRGAVRARLGGQTSIPFSLHPVKDFAHPPFG